MAGRRVPFADVPNAINSPIRAGAGKRTRIQLDEAHDLDQIQPPAKKQLLDLNQENIEPRPGYTLTKVDDQFPKRSPASQPTSLERKLAASRAKPPSRSTADETASIQQTRLAVDNLESVRQWQRHYRRQFPAFIFYLDAIPDDARSKFSRHIKALGAREEKFFSKAVTHVVTTRHIPQHVAGQPSSHGAARSARPQSVDTARAPHEQHKPHNVFDNALQKKTQPPAPEGDTKRVPSQVLDVLVRAQELGIKIWALEKLQRILKTMFEADTGEQGASCDLRTLPAGTAAGPMTKIAANTAKDADLERLLQNERVNGPADRDMTANAQETIPLRGCYIYIHDMDEKTRPVMVRDYPRPAHKTEGKWPQFHLTAQGRCPFVEDQSYIKQQPQQDNGKQQIKTERNADQQRRTRASAPPQENPVQPLGERSVNLRRSPRKALLATVQSKPLDPPKMCPPSRRTSQEEVPLFADIQTSSRAAPRMIGGMPVASGMQQSNVTSAIRSQVVSSTAISSTAPGMSRRITDSKELTALKRKVLERGASTHSQVPSSYVNEMRAAINDESAPPQRAAKRKAQETILGVVQEDGEHASNLRQKPNAIKKKKVEKDPKPGYCENCRDKFEDFDEHITSRKHQKFARSADNFRELDALLAQLKRPHKHQ